MPVQPIGLLLKQMRLQVALKDSQWRSRDNWCRQRIPHTRTADL